MRLTVSVVTFRSDPLLFVGTLHSLTDAVAYAKKVYSELICEVHIVENESRERRNFKQVKQFVETYGWEEFDDVFLEVASANNGYGAGHNQVIKNACSDYHLVLNPDVSLAPDSISVGLAYMAAHQQVALISPGTVDANGDPLYLCKRFPRVFDLFLRGFAPLSVKDVFRQRLGRYEMRELQHIQDPVPDVPIVSGCCMLFRSWQLQEVDGFDDTFFLYFEDFDLSLRIAKVGGIVYLPAMKMTHYGGYAARKGLKHLMMFGVSAVKFYNRYGWKFF
ncbi:glycosyltransferase [Oceanicoccus sp. KOV_DT_Chl]|uniref:glycosyltransferase n=1 Tax=Oceanicoccus sp. KOV_DT_Chl TaxID=1904639 RepID=UPI000C7D12EE|nr:glycosyltransferase [Oceanicoccus sp. KOV_DT_Chl]